MKITREIMIDGETITKEIELTGIELERCFNEYQYTHDKDKVLARLKNLEYKNVPDDLVDEITEQFRYEIDDNADCFVMGAITDHEDKLKQYKYEYKTFTFDVTQIKTRTYSVRALDSTQAQEIFDRYFEHHEDSILYDFDNEDPDYDCGFCRQDNTFCKPDECDITEEDEEE